MRNLSRGALIAVDGTCAEYLLQTRTATAGGTAQYGTNIEFEPGDGDTSDDFIVRYHDALRAALTRVLDRWEDRGTPPLTS